MTRLYYIVVGIILLSPILVLSEPTRAVRVVSTPHTLLAEIAPVGFVINLERRRDRFQDLVHEGHRVGLKIQAGPRKKLNYNSSNSSTGIVLERWNAFDEIDHVNTKLLEEWKRNDGQPAPPGQIGCALSHYTALQEAQRRGLQSVLLLEDDILFTATDSTELLLQLQDVVVKLSAAADPNWEMLHLGSSRCHPEHRKHTSKHVVAVAKDCWLGHAIAFREPGITRALELWPSMKLPADTFYVFLQEHILKSYVVVPPLINQRLGHSDLTANRGLLHVIPLYSPVLKCCTPLSLVPSCVASEDILLQVEKGMQLWNVGSSLLAITHFKEIYRNVRTYPLNAVVILQVTVLLAEIERQKSVIDKEPTGPYAVDAEHFFHQAITDWEKSSEDQDNMSQIVQKISASLVAMAHVGLGMLLIFQTRVEEAMVQFGIATWAAPSVSSISIGSIGSTGSTGSTVHASLSCHIAANVQHGVNLSVMAAVWLFLGSNSGAELLLERGSLFISSAVNHNSQEIDDRIDDVDSMHRDRIRLCTTTKDALGNDADDAFLFAWLCSNLGMLKMEQSNVSFDERIIKLSYSIEIYDMLLKHNGIERSRLPMVQAILALADTVAVGWMDFEKAKEMTEQAASLSVGASRLAAAAHVKALDRVKMFTKMLNGTPSESNARITYLTSQRAMLADMFVGDIASIFLRED